MTIATRTKHWGIVAAVSTVLLTLGCSGGSSVEGVADASTAAPSMLVANDNLLLSPNEFPSGTMKVELTKEALVAGFSNATGISNYKVDGPVTVTPALSKSTARSSPRSSPAPPLISARSPTSSTAAGR